MTVPERPPRKYECAVRSPPNRFAIGHGALYGAALPGFRSTSICISIFFPACGKNVFFMGLSLFPSLRCVEGGRARDTNRSAVVTDIGTPTKKLNKLSHFKQKSVGSRSVNNFFTSGLKFVFEKSTSRSLCGNRLLNYPNLLELNFSRALYRNYFSSVRSLFRWSAAIDVSAATRFPRKLKFWLVTGHSIFFPSHNMVIMY